MYVFFRIPQQRHVPNHWDDPKILTELSVKFRVPSHGDST